MNSDSVRVAVGFDEIGPLRFENKPTVGDTTVPKRGGAVPLPTISPFFFREPEPNPPIFSSVARR